MMSGQVHAPAPLPPDKQPPVAKKLGALQSWSGLSEEQKGILALPGVCNPFPCVAVHTDTTRLSRDVTSEMSTCISFVFRIVTTRAASLHEPSRERRWLTGSKETPSWGQYFGLRQHSVTDTITHYKTAVVTDPGAVVTFSVVGCQPSRLPFDLPYCKTPAPDAPQQ